MSKEHPAISIAQQERQQAAQARRQRWDRFWTIVMLAILVSFIILVIAIQISHHV
jgi:uncharacterized membrane protein (DUF485 family)